ncbi:MAG: hypothetical protein FVQ83_07880 [Chloroflexi bacterium]|nr:hypothetical protein [Chloroflexota bacterium]
MTPEAVAIRELFVNTPGVEINETFNHVYEFWPNLTRPGDHVAFPLPGNFVVPGGFFDWFFYWDSYFIITGLVVQGEWQLALDIVNNFIAEVEEFGFIPNYNSPEDVCRSRSQPPYLTAAIQEVYPFVGDAAWLENAYNAAKREYEEFWLVEPHLTTTGLSR